MTAFLSRSIGAAAAICALTACEVHGGKGVVSTVTASSTPIAANISVAPVAFPCLFGSFFSTNVDLAVQAFSTIDVTQVVLRLGNGEQVGNPITVPRAGLDAQFGTTRVMAGGTRTFALQPQFSCETFLPLFLFSDVTFLDSSDRTGTLTVQAPFR